LAFPSTAVSALEDCVYLARCIRAIPGHWLYDDDLYSVGGEHCHEPEPVAGGGLAFALHQLWRQLTLTLMVALGIVESVAMRHKKLEF
jgi:hypothetical protein